MDEIVGNAIATVHITGSLDELRVYVPPTEAFEKACEEERQINIAEEKRIQAMYDDFGKKKTTLCVLL